MFKNYKKIPEDFPASGASLKNWNFMGANDFTQKIAIAKMTINALNIFLVIFSIPIFWGEIIIPNRTQLAKDFPDAGKFSCIFLQFLDICLVFFHIFSKEKPQIRGYQIYQIHN